MDRIDLLIAHHSTRSFAAPQPAADRNGAAMSLTQAYLAARTMFWLTLGACAGFVYAFGWLEG